MKPRHFKTLIACFAVVKNKRGRILFLRRSADENYEAGKWDFPGGTKEFLESIVDGTLRECREESGLDVEIEKLLDYKVSSSRTEQDTEFVAFYYLCKPKNEEVELSDEHDDFRWLTVQEAMNLPLVLQISPLLEKIESGEIKL